MSLKSYETTVTATEIGKGPSSENDTEITIAVMRSCTFLVIRRNGRTVAHVDISPADWRKLASTPPPQDDPAGDAFIESAIRDHPAG